MADSNFDILIRVLTQQVGSEKASDILKKVKEESVNTGKEGVKQEELVEKATAKTVTTKHKLREALKGLGREFPIVGQIGRLALNPIALAATAVAAGVGLILSKIAELNAKMEEMQARLRSLDLSRLDAMRERTQGIAQDMANYLRDMDASRKENDPFAGKSFTSPEDELSQRRSEAGRLENAANTAAEAAVKNRYDPNALATQDRVKDAMGQREKLRKAVDDASSPNASDAILGTFNMMSPAAIEAAVNRRTDAARAAFQANENIISGGAGSLSRWSNRQGDLDQAAGVSKGLFTSNNARILALQGGIAQADEERRRGITGQLSEAGFGPARSVLLPGAGAAAKGWRENQGATAQDTQDFEQIIRFIKVSEREAFKKLLMAIFSDGIVTPEELVRLKAELANKSQRP